jgi:hypothetical protein
MPVRRVALALREGLTRAADGRGVTALAGRMDNARDLMTKKRDATYYKNRLRKDFPTIYSDLVAGRFTSVRQAAAKAGLIRLPTRLDEMKRAWVRATAAEKRQFEDWLKAGSKTATARRHPKSIVDRSGHLHPPVVGWLKDWLAARSARPGQIMHEMGFSRYDYRLSLAISGYDLHPTIVPALEVWLRKNGYPV